jgi:hypothetical protein
MVDGLVLFGLASTWLKDCFSIPRIDLGSRVSGLSSDYSRQVETRGFSWRFLVHRTAIADPALKFCFIVFETGTLREVQ